MIFLATLSEHILAKSSILHGKIMSISSMYIWNVIHQNPLRNFFPEANIFTKDIYLATGSNREEFFLSTVYTKGYAFPSKLWPMATFLLCWFFRLNRVFTNKLNVKLLRKLSFETRFSARLYFFDCKWYLSCFICSPAEYCPSWTNHENSSAKVNSC